jgi:hypothetical protein
MRHTLTLVLTLALATPAFAQTTPPDDKAAVQSVAERFLADLGGRRLEALPTYVLPTAAIARTRLREGKWVTSMQTLEEFLAPLRAQATATTFSEPLSNVSVNVESGHLAYLRADFAVVVGGQVRSRGVDYFVMLKDGDSWKIAFIADTSAPK